MFTFLYIHTQLREKDARISNQYFRTDSNTRKFESFWEYQRRNAVCNILSLIGFHMKKLKQRRSTVYGLVGC